jgi:ATPase
MLEADLARPLVEVRDFETGRIEYEIYTYGEENVVVPTSEINKTTQSHSVLRKLAESKIKDIIRRFDPNAEINIISDNKVQVRVSKDIVPIIIGKGGSTVSELEKMLGIKIDIESKNPALGKEIDFEMTESDSALTFVVGQEAIGKSVEFYLEEEFLFNSQVGKKARIKVDRRTENAQKMLDAFAVGKKVRLFMGKGNIIS